MTDTVFVWRLRNPVYLAQVCISNNRAVPYTGVKRGTYKQVQYCIQGKFRPRFIFALFALYHVGEFKTGLIELFENDYVRKFETGRIQDWANQF